MIYNLLYNHIQTFLKKNSLHQLIDVKLKSDYFYALAETYGLILVVERLCDGTIQLTTLGKEYFKISVNDPLLIEKIENHLMIHITPRIKG